jgi:catechol 2,3-dioxygenase-like lactoylglutathione lyase family enzyme
MDSPIIKGIHHICLKVPDVSKSVEFYTKYMDYKFRLDFGVGMMIESPDGSYLEFFKEDDEKGYTHVAYACDEVDAAFKRAIDAGCEPVEEPKDFQILSKPPLDVRIAFFKDPAGNTIELFHE